MNVLFIPSWYPHRCWPLEGIFLHDQAVAVGELRPDWRVGISLWGQGMRYVSIAHLRKSPRCLLDALLDQRRSERELRPNVVEFTTPALSWRARFLQGNRRAVLDANRRNLQSAVRRFGSIDLLHAHVSYPAGWVAMKLSAESGIPFVITEHMGPFPLPVYERADGALAPFIREPLERAGARIAVSPTLCARIESFGIPRPEYVPNVVDERLYAPGPSPEGDGFTFFTLCQMETVKGIPDLLQAIRLLLDRLPAAERARIRFRLGGTGSQFHAFQAEARRLGLEEWIAWLGFLPRDEARREYQRCDCFILPSKHESFGIVLVEAGAFGKPVIATRAGGPEAIVTPENGVLVDVGQPAALAGAMLAMIEGARAYDPRLIREQFILHFSRAAVVGRLEEIYRRALAVAGAGDGRRGTWTSS
jgi:glycosyltransferase involved in cell wall biosynthesis